MTTQELTSLALKVFALYVLVKGLLAIPSVISTLVFMEHQFDHELGDYGFAVASILTIALVLALSYFIWRLANHISGLTEPREPQAVQPEVEPFIISVVGLFLLSQALVKLIYISIGAFVQANDPNNPIGVSPETVAHLTAYILQAVLGVSLLIRSNGWVTLLHKLRTAGT